MILIYLKVAGNWSIVLLCLWQLLWWFSWSTGVGAHLHPHLVCPVFLCTHLFRVRVLHVSLPPVVHIHLSFYLLSHLILIQAPHWVPNLCHTSFHNQASYPDSSPSICNFHFMVYHVMGGVSPKNKNQDTGSPDSTVADLFWMFVVDSSAKYIKE